MPNEYQDIIVEGKKFSRISISNTWGENEYPIGDDNSKLVSYSVIDIAEGKAQVEGFIVQKLALLKSLTDLGRESNEGKSLCYSIAEILYFAKDYSFSEYEYSAESVWTGEVEELLSFLAKMLETKRVAKIKAYSEHLKEMNGG